MAYFNFKAPYICRGEVEYSIIYMSVEFIILLLGSLCRMCNALGSLQ